LDSGLAFEWDDANRDHITHHQVSPEEAEQVTDNDPLDIEAETVEANSALPASVLPITADSYWSSQLFATLAFGLPPPSPHPRA
jgi:hypothetical protein